MFLTIKPMKIWEGMGGEIPLILGSMEFVTIKLVHTQPPVKCQNSHISVPTSLCLQQLLLPVSRISENSLYSHACPDFKEAICPVTSFL